MPLFELRTFVATPGALAFCELNEVNPLSLLGRHLSGDYGDLTLEDVAANVLAVQHDLRIFSSYRIGDGRVWIITEGDRSSTCLLLPCEY